MSPEYACYDLAAAPASWDFVTWLVRAEQAKRAAGITAPLKVVFKPGPNGGFRDDSLPLTLAQRQGMLDNVMRPALALVGAVESEDAFDGCSHPYLTRAIVDAFWSGQDPPKLIEGRGDPDGPVVITWREADYWPARNADIYAWIVFIQELREAGEEVFVIRDTANADKMLPDGIKSFPVASREVAARVELMTSAKINFMMNTGPAVLAIFSEVPYRILKPLAPHCPATSPEWWANMIGVPVGKQYPWATEGQAIVWAEDRLAELRAAWRDFLDDRAERVAA